MSLNERLDYEKGKITSSELFTKTCCQCKYWIYRVTHKLDYCHKCINNPKVPIRSKHGYSIEALYDYYSPTPCPIIKYTKEINHVHSNLTLLPTVNKKTLTPKTKKLMQTNVQQKAMQKDIQTDTVTAGSHHD